MYRYVHYILYIFYYYILCITHIIYYVLRMYIVSFGSYIDQRIQSVRFISVQLLVVFVEGDVIYRVANLVREIPTDTSCHLV